MTAKQQRRLQKRLAEITTKRRGQLDPHIWLCLVMEEVGEVAMALDTIYKSPPDDKAWRHLENEIVDVIAYAQAMLASQFPKGL